MFTSTILMSVEIHDPSSLSSCFLVNDRRCTNRSAKTIQIRYSLQAKAGDDDSMPQ